MILKMMVLNPENMPKTFLDNIKTENTPISKDLATSTNPSKTETDTSVRGVAVYVTLLGAYPSNYLRERLHSSHF